MTRKRRTLCANRGLMKMRTIEQATTYDHYKSIRSSGTAYAATAHMALAIMRDHDHGTMARAYANLGRAYPCRSGDHARHDGVSASHGPDFCYPGGWTPFDPRRGAAADMHRAQWYGRRS